ncbi:50S ribosomal protein L13 [Clostridiales bacterium CHKCI006]|nr:50S ribosomal protein L13 [Clostridiales bacterium CHKCI006]
MRQTTMAKEATIERKWYVVDAAGMTLGRLASQVATVLRGKHKPTYTPHVDTGDYVIIVNASKVVMTGKKLDKKMYYHHSGWLGGLKSKTARQFLEKDPVGFVESAVKGMLPHNTLGRKQGMKLFVYAGSEHPHAAQKPETLTFKG